ncbi:Mitogen-activated protein kinase kinase kinase 1 [Rhynchospora pubera]|uniref:Mitogen-activated protein kinase kinase kinase 1 n=1 Tax=Rhynchospora pubera TaxID=906938 RepID=A0AAV8DPN7_9POAL|nr:Mitogen-activated protein kinase kinase kinase 1 [Rhynchospora pubera]
MESVGSNSPPRTRTRARSRSDDPNQAESAQHVADRIIRALEHQLRLLHRDGPHFYILGSTGNVYTVALAAVPSCTCPDRSNPCKHILFVLLRVLNLTFDEASVWRRSIRPCELARFLALPTASDVLAGPRARAMFLRMLSGANQQGRELPDVTVLRQEGAVCPVCLDEMTTGQGLRLVTCGTCGNSVHGECFDRWKRSRGRRGVSCVVCRARWRERRDGGSYVNLSVYVSGDEEPVPEGNEGFCVT